MDNFTPLKTEKRKQTNKFLIIGNIFLIAVLIFISNFFLKDKLIPTQQQAVVPLLTRIPTATRVPTPTLSKTPTPTATIEPTEGPSATPTEIIIAKISSASPTIIVSLPKTGTLKSFIYIIPALIMLAGLIL